MQTHPNYPGMTNVAGEIAALEFDWENYEGEDKWKKMTESYEAQHECLKQHDDAGREAGKFEGRFISAPRGDGSAYYEVAYVQDGMAYLRWIQFGDNWHSPEIEDLCEAVQDPLNPDGCLLEVPLKFVEKRLKRGDAWLKTITAAKEKQNGS